MKELVLNDAWLPFFVVVINKTPYQVMIGLTGFLLQTLKPF